MKSTAIIIGLLIVTSSIPSLTSAIETAPRITDREIVERLTKVETKLDSIEKRIDSVEKSINQLREDMNAQFNRIDSQFNRMTNIMLGILGAFVVLLSGTIWFALWDRRTMIRPFETRVKVIAVGP